MKETSRRLKIGVFGHSNSKQVTSATLKWAESFGECVARRNGTLYTGGGGGVMLAARKGSLAQGGMVVSINPEIELDETTESHNYLGNVIKTGQGKIGRVHLLVQSIDIGFALGGGAGTLLEIISCYLLAKPVIVVYGFQGSNDPEVIDILNKVEQEFWKGSLIKIGYIDGKAINQVCPVRVCSNNLAPEEVISIGISAWQSCDEKKHNMG